jgi:hypothetical protein
MHMLDLAGLLVAPPVLVQCLDQLELQEAQSLGLGTSSGSAFERVDDADHSARH